MLEPVLPKLILQPGVHPGKLRDAAAHQIVHLPQVHVARSVHPRLALRQRLQQHILALGANQYVFQPAALAAHHANHRQEPRREWQSTAASYFSGACMMA